MADHHASSDATRTSEPRPTTVAGEWTHIADHAWEMHATGVHYTLHRENDQWVARSFALSHSGDTSKEAEESAPTIEQAEDIVQKWQSRQTK